MIRLFRGCGGAFLVGAAALALLGGCASAPQSQALLQSPRADLDRAIELTDVPFYPQRRYQCGPAALASMLGWSGAAVTPDELTPQVYIPERRGSLQPELLAAARRYHRVPYVLDAELISLLREVQAGHPVLVLQNLAYSWYPRWHYAVVVGFDLDRRELIMRSGVTARHTVSLGMFEHTWRRAGRWAVVIPAPNELPATAREPLYLRAVLPFERAADWITAAAAYRSAGERWPESLGASFGLGNSSYHLADYAAAETAFRRVLELEPDHPPAHNNLALVLLKQGRVVEARQSAERALAIDPGNPIYKATLDEIGREGVDVR